MVLLKLGSNSPTANRSGRGQTKAGVWSVLPQRRGLGKAQVQRQSTPRTLPQPHPMSAKFPDPQDTEMGAKSCEPGPLLPGALG